MRVCWVMSVGSRINYLFVIVYVVFFNMLFYSFQIHVMLSCTHTVFLYVTLRGVIQNYMDIFDNINNINKLP